MTDRFAKRVAKANWQTVTDEVNDSGCALLPHLLTPREAAEIAQLYDDAGRFRATINMARHRFGEGEYRYFDKPFPEAVESLRQALYPRLLPIARDWYAKLGREAEWPDTLDEWLDICHRAGQTRPTSSTSTSPASITPAASSSWWNNAHEPSHAAPRPSSPTATASSSPPATARSAQPAAGPPPPSATASPPSAPGTATPWAWSSTTPSSRLSTLGHLSSSW